MKVTGQSVISRLRSDTVTALLLGADREPGSELPLAEQFRFDAGSPALNLLATLGYRGSGDPVERLSSPARLREWLAGNDLPAVPVNAAGLAAARELREAGYAVLAAVLADRRPPRAAVACLDRWAARPLPGPGLRLRGGTLHRTSAGQTLDSVLTALARELAERAVDGATQLRICTGEACAMIYLDRSRGRRRRWCSMNRCGNAAKVARHRARAARRSA